MSNLKTCPRCAERSYEVLKTHAYCLCCNYTPDLLSYHKSSGDDLPIPPWAAGAVAQMQPNKTRAVIKSIPVQKQNNKKGSAA